MDASSSLEPGTTTGSGKFTKPGQVQVIFHNVEETYTVGVDVQCTYTVNGSLEVSSRDWVGLYRVGWRSRSDYYYYDWSPMPADYEKGKEFNNKIIFPAHKLPKDDGEFYQFCYVTSAGQVRGASTPFQFRQPSMDDLIEIEDENGELLVIKTKTALLEEKLKKANEVKVSLKQQIQMLENERSLLLATERQLQRKLQQQKEEEEAIREKLEEANDMNSEQKLQLEHMQCYMSSFQEKTEILNQEKATMEKRLDENDAYIVSLQEKIKALVNEKDALTGRIRSLEEEGTLLRGYVVESDRLKTRLMEEEICGARMKKEVERMEDEIQEQQIRLENQLRISSADKETIDCLCERLRNAEDKLSAAEHCKMMLNEEVLTMKQAFEKMSSNLEESKVATDSIRKTLFQTEQNLKTEIKLLNKEKQDTEEKFEAVTEKAEVMEKEIAELKTSLEEKANRQRSEAEGSLYALEMAQATLKERYMKMTKKFEANQRALEQALSRVNELETNADDQKLEIDHLKERLRMAEETYKEKYIECEMLESKLFKQKLASYKRLDFKGPSVPSDSEKNSSPKGTSPEMVTETQQELEYIRTALEKYYAKAEKYKKLYIEEKYRTDELQKKLLEKEEDFNLVKDIWIKPRGPPGDAYVKYVKPFEKSSDAKKSFDASSTSSLKSMESFDAVDGSAVDGMMQVPLRPLPPPMLPQKLSPTNLTAPTNFTTPADNGVWNMTDNLEVDGGIVFVQNDQLTTANACGERFEDASGEPQKICPVCFQTFDYGVSENDYLEHIDSHYTSGPICPMCSKQYDEGYPMREFTEHVNSHFDSA